MSYVVEVRAVGESSFVPNGLRYPAEEYRVVESPDPVNVDADGNLLPEVHP